MLRIENLSGEKNNSRVVDFSIEINKAEVHVLLSSSLTFLNDFICLLRKDKPISEGSIVIDGKNIFSNNKYHKIQFITNDDLLYEELSVADNVFFQKRKFLILMNKNSDEKKMKNLAYETGFYLRPSKKIADLTSEERKIAEILKSYYMEPELLVASEVSNQLSYKSYSIFKNVLDKMKKQGSYIIYLTSQWEEALKVADVITVVANKENCGTYNIDEIRKDPSLINDLIVGGKRFLKTQKNPDELEMLKNLNKNILDLTSGYDLRKTLGNLSNHLVTELGASNCVVFLINPTHDSVIEIGAQAKSKGGQEITNLKAEIIWRILKEERPEFFNKSDPNYLECFNGVPQEKTFIAFPIIMSSQVRGLIQISFDDYYVLAEKDSLMLNWVSKEIAIITENSRLLGRSVLLQESFHRIKNNLQIVISLIEMEKDVAYSWIADQDSYTTFCGMLDNVIGRIKSISKIHNLLSKEQIINEMIDMRVIVEEICAFYKNDARIEYNLEQIYIPHAKAVSIALVVNELISNSIKHNPENHINIVVDVKKNKLGDIILLKFSDDGCGFKSGNNTKMEIGVGTMILKSIINIELNGEINFYNQNGAVVEMKIPQKAFILGRTIMPG